MKPNASSLRPLIVSRCDRIGDLVLSLPVLAFLRKAGFGPLILHCSGYAGDIGRWALHNGLCDLLWIVGDTPPRVVFSDPNALGLCLQYSPASIAGFRSAKLRNSMGPRTQISALWNFKKSIPQHRSRVEKSEMQYNLDLARELLKWLHWDVPEFEGLPALQVPELWHSPKRSPDSLFVVSNRGSSQDWPLENYLKMAREKRGSSKKVAFLVSGQDAPLKIAQLKKENVEASGMEIIESFAKLSELIAFIAGCGEVISSSTGPLHIAHAAGVPVLGIYPKSPPVQSFKRWRPEGYWHTAPVRFVEIDE